ncbi:FUSC family protein [Paraburkholderia caribensis]|uniref:FUSC family protein n=1 Tax=Paraburkholderia caribensis TaxID=75105 RepID=UPI00071F1C9B|nr:FUSC family protein [Paraburkholderia caribensis]ALP64594.1 fusaric acid resistance protein [Paraburkholderia caribensis]AUT54257.1 FUSC family protein [Paraburkholderia caribensis]
MKRQHAIKQVSSDTFGSRAGMLRAIADAGAEWATTDGLIWLHLFKTVLAALLALGIAMLLELQQPRTAMTTVFVLMQPFSGMVLAKSFYRIVGTFVGMLAALLLGALFAQQPELYMLGITAWMGACVAAAVRYRHFRWYGFVLAGYTAALIGIPTVMEPNGLFLAALTRAAEVAIGIVCSAAVSALIVPRRSSLALQNALQSRHLDFTAFAMNVLDGAVERGTSERYFADLVDEVVGFEATRAFAAFEDPGMRSRSQVLARLNHEFMDICARLHALHQLRKRLRGNPSVQVVQATAPYFHELSQLLGVHKERRFDSSDAARIAIRLKAFQATLPVRMRATRRPLESDEPQCLPDFDTAGELLYRFVVEFIRYIDTYASLETNHNPARERPPVRYVSRTNAFVVACTFARTAAVVGAISAFWIATNWPSGGMAVIGAALTCALTSSAPNPVRLALQMAVGAACATLAGYLVTCYVYPAVDGFPLLCAMLAPVLAVGTFFASRTKTAGYGVGFTVFFCLLAAPDNVVAYAPDLLINNGIAIVVSMLVTAIGAAIVFPVQMPWLIARIEGDLRGQVTLACTAPLTGLAQRFQSSTHDLMHQLRMLLPKRSRRHRNALRWMLVTLEVGHAAIDLRSEIERATYASDAHARWKPSLDRVTRDLAQLFERPDRAHAERTQISVRAAMRVVQQVLEAVHTDREKRHDQQRILSCLHFIRTALLDKGAPFDTR